VRSSTRNITSTVSVNHSWFTDLCLLVKVKLSLTVVLTSGLGFLIASKYVGFQLSSLILFLIGGMLVTFSANAINQVLEKDFDCLMTRTKDRPIASGRMKVSEAIMIAGIMCLFGVTILSLFNPLTALLGMLSFVTYAFVYTPLKRYSTAAVAVGAVPGALPVLIGFTAVDGRISLLALLLFLIQFAWQFPHFWAIGFLSFTDYSKAGYKLLPVDDSGVLDKSIGISSIVYAFVTLACTFGLYYIDLISMISFCVMGVLSLLYIYFSYRFHSSYNRETARGLMFFSFFYMPIVLIINLFY